MEGQDKMEPGDISAGAVIVREIPGRDRRETRDDKRIRILSTLYERRQAGMSDMDATDYLVREMGGQL